MSAHALDSHDHFLEANGLRFHYRTHGNPAAPPILLLHSITGHAWEWDRIARALQDEYYVVALDQRGHGATDHADAYSWGALADDALAVGEALGLGQPRVAGHSMGGAAAYLAAARLAEAGRQFAALALVDVTPAALADASVRDRVAGFLRMLREPAAEPSTVTAEWIAGSPQADADQMRAYVEYNLVPAEDGRWRWRHDAVGLEALLRDASEVTDASMLRAITCPTLVLRGADSFAVAPEDAAGTARTFPRGRAQEIEGAGHDIHIDAPDALIRALRAFFHDAP